MNAPRDMRRFLLPMLSLLSSCYNYVPIDPSVIGPGISVRARVTPAAADRIAPLLGGPSDSRVITGLLIETSPAGLIVEVPTMVPGEIGSTFQTLHQRVSISRSELLELETSRLDPFRTAAIVGTAAVIASTVAFKATRREAGKERIPGGGGSETRVPLFQLHW